MNRAWLAATCLAGATVGLGLYEFSRPQPSSCSGAAASPQRLDGRAQEGPGEVAVAQPPRVPPPLPSPPRSSRTEAMRETRDRILKECRRSAGGDWERWQQQVRPWVEDYRLRAKQAVPFNPKAKGYFEARSEVLAPLDDFGCFECTPNYYLKHLLDPTSVDRFRQEQPLVLVSRWLKRRGIDLIFVPVPKMSMVYPDHFAEHCPPDKIVAPHLRKLIVELIDADVEVIDLLPTFLETRDGPEPLFLPCDPHWGPRAYTLAASSIAQYLQRYDFAKEGKNREPAYTTASDPCSPSGWAGYEALDPEQRRVVDRSQQRMISIVSSLHAEEVFSDRSPLISLGDSYNGYFDALLVKNLNTPIHALSGGGQTTQRLKEFIRDPKLLKDCKVVLWLNCCSVLSEDWPVPEPIRKEVGVLATK